MIHDILVEYMRNNLGVTITALILFIWQLPWKAVALWKSARRKEYFWFIVIFFVYTFAILEIFYLFYIVKIKIRWFEKKLKKKNLNID